MIRRTLDDIRARARAELAINPTISVYTMVDGVEKRRPYNPWVAYRAAMAKLGHAFVSITPSVDRFREQLREQLRDALGGQS